MKSKVVTVGDLFLIAGIDYNKIPQNTSIDVSEDNIRIKSFNHKTNKVEFKKVLKLVRKEDANMYEVSANNKYFLATAEHKIFTKEFGYIELKDIKEPVMILWDDGSFYGASIVNTNKTYPVLDMTVEDNENYFSANILSHNSPETTTGGNALKFYASIRLDVRNSSDGKDINEEFGQKAKGVKIKVVKNKLAPPHMVAELVLHTNSDTHEYGFNIYDEVIDISIEKGLIKKAGSWFSYGEERIGQGKPVVINYLKNNPDIFDSLYKKIISDIKTSQDELCTVYKDSFDSKIQETASSTDKISKRSRKSKDGEPLTALEGVDLSEKAIEESIKEIKEAEVVEEEK